MTNEIKRLYRSRSERIIGGVCGGLGQYLSFDPTLIRLIFIILALLGGPGIIVYLIMWLEQTLIAMVLGPFMGVLMLALFWKRANRPGSLAGFVTGALFAVFMQQVLHINIFFQISWWSFVLTLAVTAVVSLLTAPPAKEKIEGLIWESDFRAKLGEVIHLRAETHSAKVTAVPEIKVQKPPWYLNLKYWATAILLAQVVLLFFFG